MKRAIVLAGGGGKGAYQMGVWKALRRLHIKYDIVTGTSIGSVNGAYMVTKEYYKALNMWKNIDFNEVFDKKIDNNLDLKKRTLEVKKIYVKTILLEDGMNIEKLENVLRDNLNEDKIRKSKIDYGLITVNYTKLKSLELTKQKIKEGQLLDFIMASCTCFPFFKKRKIDKYEYIDGGYHDNLPINLAIDMGATDIIAIDLKAIGINKKVKKSGVNIRYISPNNDLHSILDFEKSLSIRAINLGYNDAMKSFGYLEGGLFTFKLNDLDKNYKRYKIEYIKNVNRLFVKLDDSTILNKILLNKTSNSLFKNKESLEIKNIFNDIVEYLGYIFDLKDDELYRINKYNKLLKLKFRKELNSNKSVISNILEFIVNNKKDNIDRIVYIYNKVNKYYKTTDDIKELAIIATTLTKDFTAALYLYTIINNR